MPMPTTTRRGVNPYRIIARKIISTQDVREAEIKQLKYEIERVKHGLGIKHSRDISELFMAYGFEENPSDEEQIAFLNALIEDMQETNAMVEDAFDYAVHELPEGRIRDDARRSLTMALIHTGELRFGLLPYPLELSELDFQTRRERVFNRVLANKGLLPYKYRPYKPISHPVILRRKNGGFTND